MAQKIFNESNGSQALFIKPTKQKHREDLRESTSVVQAKYPSKVKLDREFQQL